MSEPQCREARRAAGLPYGRSTCFECGSIIRAGWRCPHQQPIEGVTTEVAAAVSQNAIVGALHSSPEGLAALRDVAEIIAGSLRGVQPEQAFDPLRLNYIMPGMTLSRAVLCAAQAVVARLEPAIRSQVKADIEHQTRGRMIEAIQRAITASEEP